MSEEMIQIEVYPHNENASRDAWSAYLPASLLRDVFAGMVASGLSVGCAGMLSGSFSAYAKGPCNEEIAHRAYSVADALMAERARRKGETT